jgi:putative tryptophan/tyrosine transport system substrate-binding protein
VRRRQFITILGGAALWPALARAQQSGSIPKIGVLWPGVTFPPAPRMEAFREALRQLGYFEGQNVMIELRYAQGGLEQLPRLATELVSLRVDVIAAFGDLAPKTVQQVTATIPIVAVGDDILGAGLIGGRSDPGANTTGLTIFSPELSAKRLEILQAIVPGISRVAVFWDPTTGRSQVTTSENAARALKLNLQIIEVGSKDDIVRAFRATADAHAQALSVLSSPFLASLYRGIIDSAAEFRLPAIYQWKEHVEAGGLVSYGPNLAAIFRQAATIVVKILKGAKPSDLPVEQPTKFELVINMRTAKALGIALSPTLVARVDEVIE